MELNEQKLPEKIKRRIKLAKLFYPLDRNEERRWGRLFISEWKIITDRFAKLADEKGYCQKELDQYTIIWYDRDNDSAECMFCFINDATDFKAVYGIFKQIEKQQPLFTNAIVHQKKDGEGVYDIFRFSKFSYLEHCNRVRAPKLKD